MKNIHFYIFIYYFRQKKKKMKRLTILCEKIITKLRFVVGNIYIIYTSEIYKYLTLYTYIGIYDSENIINF